MSSPCVIQTCKHISCALCFCCAKSLCIDHLKQHQNPSNSQLNYFVDEINTLTDQILVLDADITDKSHQKLEKWRDDSYMMIDRYYEEKHQQLQQHYIERADKYRRDIDRIKEKANKLMHEEKATDEDISSLKTTINHIKYDIKQFEEKGIMVDIHALIIDKDLIQIQECTSNKIDISTLPPPIRKMDCLNVHMPLMASNNRYLLMDQYPNLCLFDKELIVIKQSPWVHDSITDMCWSSTLNSFVIVTEEDGAFRINEDMTLIESIQTIGKEEWLLCTCSGEALYLITDTPNPTIFQFNLLSSFNLVKQWNPPESCTEDEFINDIAYNNGALAFMIENTSNETMKIELRLSTTLDRLWSLPLDLPSIEGEWIYRVCLLKYDEWLVIDDKTSKLLHISKDGKLKVTEKYDPTPINAVLFGSDILAIRTTNCVNLYNV